MKNAVYNLLTEATQVAPNEVAIIEDSWSCTFQELLRSVDSAASALASLSIQSGQVVVIADQDARSWILTCALAKLGASSISVQADDVPYFLPGLFDVALIRRRSSDSVVPGKRIEISADWFAGVDDQRPAYAFDSDALVRGVPTSGSSGARKVSMLSERSVEARIASLRSTWAKDTREMNLMGLSTAGGFGSGLASLALRKPFFKTRALGGLIPQFIYDQEIESLIGSPNQIATLLDLTSSSKLLSRVSSIRMTGAAPSKKLLKRLADFPTLTATVAFASSEAGVIFTQSRPLDPDFQDLGELRTGARVRIVDEQGDLVKVGEVGVLEIQSPSLHSGYLLGVSPIRLSPSKPWYTTDDLVLHDGARYFYRGRQSAVINIGGVKINTLPIDEYVANLPGVSEAVSFTAVNSSGVDFHVMAVVCDSNEVFKSLSQTISDSFPGRMPGGFWRIRQVPKVGLGKPDRAKLIELFQREYERDAPRVNNHLPG